MDPSSDHRENGVVGFDFVDDSRVSGYGKGVVTKSYKRDPGFLEYGGNDRSLVTNLVGSRVHDVGELHAIDLVVDLSQCSKKEAMASLKPEKIIHCVQDLAKDPFWMTPFEASTMEAELSSFNLWKGDYQLHINEILDELDNFFDDVNSDEEVTKESNLNDRSRKHKNALDNGSSPTKKVKSLSDLMSDVEYKPKKRGRKRKNREFSGKELLSQIRMAARNPFEKQHNLDSLVRFSSEFRNYHKGTKTQKVIQPEITEDGGFKGVKDSYWTDRIIEAKPTKENSPTALILKFTNLESVPSLKKLNGIFGRFGALQKEETKVLKKKNCVKMVFERRCDAESAFSSSGKFSVFGPSLVSYCLNFSPTPRKTGTRGRNLKKDVKSVKGIKFEN